MHSIGQVPLSVLYHPHLIHTLPVFLHAPCSITAVSLHSPQLGNIHKQEVLETSLAVLNLLSSLKIRAAVLEANMRQAGKRVPNMTEFVE